MKRIANYLIALAVAAITFTSCEDVPSPYGEIVKPEGGGEIVIDPTGSGTEADPYNVAAVLEFISGLGADTPSEKEVYIKGYVTETTDISTQYGNATFNISDTQEGANTFMVWRAKGLGNQDVTDESFIKVGDVVVICGKVTNYKGNTPETVQGAAYVYSINGNKGGDTPAPTPTADLGTKDNPLTVAKALEIINGLEDNKSTDGDAFVTGTITKIKTTEENIAKYKNIDYIISDGTNELTVFRGKNINNTDFTAAGEINVGDVVVVTGKLTKYVKDGNTTPEVAQGNYIVTLTKSGGGGDTPSGEAKGSGTKEDPYNVTAISQIAAKLGDKEISTSDYYIKGKICSIKYTFSAQYGTATFNISEDGNTGGTEFTCYSVYYYDMKSWVDGNTQVAIGNEVIIYGKITNYGGTLETASKKACIYSLNGKTEGGSEGGGSEGGGTTTGNEITASFADLDCSNVASIKLSDGTTLSATQEDGNNSPVYHEGSKIIRLYARNAFTINAGSKKIDKVVFAYDTYNGTAYKGNDEMYGEGASKITPTKDDKTVTFSNVANSTLKVVNWFEEKNSGGTQFRITGLTITYAK